MLPVLCVLLCRRCLCVCDDIFFTDCFWVCCCVSGNICVVMTVWTGVFLSVVGPCGCVWLKLIFYIKFLN